MEKNEGGGVGNAKRQRGKDWWIGSGKNVEKKEKKE